MKDIESIDVRKVYRGVRRDAQKQITDHFDLLVADQRDRRTAHYEAEEDAAATLGRLLGSDEKYAATVRPRIDGAVDRFVSLDEASQLLPGLSREKIMNLTNGCSVMDAHTGVGGFVGIVLAKDTRLDVFAAPYADSWTHAEGQHQQMITEANKSTGFLRVVYTMNKEGGSVYLGAGVAVLFMRNVAGHPPGQGPA